MLWEKLAHRFPTEKYIRGGLMPALAMAPKDARYLGYAVYVLTRALASELCLWCLVSVWTHCHFCHW